MQQRRKQGFSCCPPPKAGMRVDMTCSMNHDWDYDWATAPRLGENLGSIEGEIDRAIGPTPTIGPSFPV